MDLVLIRHAQPEVAAGTCYGCLDLPLVSPLMPVAAQIATGLPAPARTRYTEGGAPLNSPDALVRVVSPVVLLQRRGARRPAKTGAVKRVSEMHRRSTSAKSVGGTRRRIRADRAQR